MLLEKQRQVLSYYVTRPFTMACRESHKLSITNVKYILLKYVMLHASFCGDLPILITEFMILTCDCPQEVYMSFPFSLSKVPKKC